MTGFLLHIGADVKALLDSLQFNTSKVIFNKEYTTMKDLFRVLKQQLSLWHFVGAKFPLNKLFPNASGSCPYET